MAEVERPRPPHRERRQTRVQGLIRRNFAGTAEIRIKHMSFVDLPSVDDDIEGEQFCELGPKEKVERVHEVDGTERKPLRSLGKVQVPSVHTS